MRNYVVFTYQFSPIIDDIPSLFGDEIDPYESMEHKNDIFDSIVNNDNFVISYRNSRFNRQMLLNQDSISVFKLANRKYLRYERNFQPNMIETNPSVYVIVDNRYDKQRILIEERTDAFYDESYVARILQNSLRNALKPNKLDINISKEYQTNEFWDLINLYDRRIERIRFAFPYPNLSRIRDNMRDLISEINSSTNSKNTKIELNAASGEILNVSRDNEVISGLVETSAGYGQGISFKAKGIKHQQVVGGTKRTITIDEFEGQLSDFTFEQIINKLNKL